MDASTVLPPEPVPRDVVYGTATPDGYLLFLTRNRAQDLAQTRAALHTAQTWDDFQSRLPDRYWREVVEQPIAHGQAEPEPVVPFEPEAVPGYADGVWPSFGVQLMREWMPAEVWHRVDPDDALAPDGGLPALDGGSLQEIVGALEAHGFTCEEDEGLIAQASGLEAGERV